jgi:hypothetical protein
MTTVFLRVLRDDNKATALRAAISAPAIASGKQRFEVDPKIFGSVPGSPFCYWVGDHLRSVFSKFPPIERGRRAARAGGQTSDDARYLRTYWEIDQNSTRNVWHTYLKGGKAAKFYFDQVLVAPWDVRRSTFPGFLGRPGRASEKPSNYELYFQPGLTWPLRASVFSPQVMPAECIFTVRSYAIIDDRENLLSLLAVLASSAADYIAKLLLGRFGFPEFVVGALQKLPIPDLSGEDTARLELLARKAWSLQRSLDATIETSHAFNVPALLCVEGDTSAVRVRAWAEHIRVIRDELAAIQAEIDTRCFALYGIDESDRRVIAEDFEGDRTTLEERADNANEEDGERDEEQEDEEEDAEGSVTSETLIADLVSWAAGVAFGRFDVRLATGVRTVPAEPDPFDRLPIWSPATLISDDNKPSARTPAGYPLGVFETGILVDDAGHPRDLSTAVRAVFDVVFGPAASSWWAEVAAVLAPKSHDLREWLSTDLFEHHLKRHSRSGRKAPIVWQLATPSGRYSVWLYAHRLTPDTFFQVQNELIAPKLAYAERQLMGLVESAGTNPSPKDRKQISEQEAFVGELRSLLDEVKRIAPLWNPSLDDGVVLTMAPLWRLIPQHKPWQKELKNKWAELAAGKYDWAYIAMRLWPERVVPKCAANRSFAIAHGLEDVFWAEGADGTWNPRPIPTRPVDELVRARTSAAVKAALQGLTDTLATPDPKTRTRRSSS